jgi:hypothetical protein
MPFMVAVKPRKHIRDLGVLLPAARSAVIIYGLVLLSAVHFKVLTEWFKSMQFTPYCFDKFFIRSAFDFHFFSNSACGNDLASTVIPRQLR